MGDNSSNIINSKSNIKDFFSINDLREKEYESINLSTNERVALKNFDRYRISELNSQKSEANFHNRYMQLQVMANLSPYNEFLKEEYFS
jgi:hypothetical protein